MSLNNSQTNWKFQKDVCSKFKAGPGSTIKHFEVSKSGKDNILMSQAAPDAERDEWKGTQDSRLESSVVETGKTKKVANISVSMQSGTRTKLAATGHIGMRGSPIKRRKESTYEEYGPKP